MVSAHVLFDLAGGQPKNTIIFHAGKTGANADCVHTVIYQGDREEVLRWYEGAPREPLAPRPALLPPWEHFVALKSYVAGIADAGIFNLLRTCHAPGAGFDGQDLPYGFNFEMQQQVLRALAIVAPGAARTVLRDWFMEVIDLAPREWMLSRVDLFADLFPLDTIVADIRASDAEWARAHGETLKAFVGFPLHRAGTRHSARPMLFSKGAWGTLVHGPSASCYVVSDYASDYHFSPASFTITCIWRLVAMHLSIIDQSGEVARFPVHEVMEQLPRYLAAGNPQGERELATLLKFFRVYVDVLRDYRGRRLPGLGDPLTDPDCFTRPYAEILASPLDTAEVTLGLDRLTGCVIYVNDSGVN